MLSALISYLFGLGGAQNGLDAAPKYNGRKNPVIVCCSIQIFFHWNQSKKISFRPKIHLKVYGQ